MPRNIGRFVVALAILNAFSNAAYAQRPGRDAAVAHALADLEAWLDKAPSAEGWRTYLRLQDLESQVQLGSNADANQVAGTLERLESGSAGLERPQFAKLRNALIEWRRDLTAPKLEQLAELARQAKSQFRPVDAKVVEADRAIMVRASSTLSRFLGRDANAQAWASYLRLELLNKQLAPGVEPPLEALGSVLTQLRTDKVGLDRPQFTNLATALADYIVTIQANRNPNAHAQFDARLDKLSEHLEAYTKEPSADGLKQIGIDVDWLIDRRQALPLADSITRQLSKPNLYVSVAGDFLAAGLNRSIDEISPVRDTILGTRIVGTGRTQGDVTFRLVPNPDVAMLEATLEGVNRSRNVGYNGPAIIHSVGTTRLIATKWLSIDVDGIHGHKATAGADTSTHITSIGSSKRGVMGNFVERVAKKRVSQQKGTAESIASDHAELRLNRQFEEQIGKELARSNLQFQERFRNPLVRRGQLPHIYFSTTNDRLNVTALQAHGAQLGAQTPAPDVSSQAQISLRLHESLVTNFTGGTLAGETIGQPELEEFAKEFLGEVPDRLKDDPGKDPWTITFADDQPISFTVADGGFSLTGRGKKYTSGDRSYPAMNFTVKYKIEKLGQGVKGTRIGDVEIFPPGFVPGGDRRLSLPQVTLRRLMMRRLEKIFEAEIVKSEPTELKNEWKAAGPLEVTELTADRGWLSVGWRQARPANTAQAGGNQTPAAEVAR